MRVAVDAWDPTYGTSADDAGTDAADPVELEIERVVEAWGPIAAPADGLPDEVTFVDGVRRIDARVWVEGDAGGSPEPGLAASWAAGAVRCNGLATIAAVEVGRGLFTASPHATDLPTAHGTYVRRAASASSPEELSLRLQQAMTEAEVAVSDVARHDGSGFLVVDGPLRGRQQLADTVGMVKTHYRQYLPDDLRPLLRHLDPGERTPLFRIGGPFLRQSWYVRLPGGEGPMAGIVRCECSPHVPTDAAIRLAGWSAAILPRFASEPHKDPRAPQNLYPIAGLERELRRRLGDGRLLYRALRVAAAA
jgi:uncharacterized protein